MISFQMESINGVSYIHSSKGCSVGRMSKKALELFNLRLIGIDHDDVTLWNDDMLSSDFEQMWKEYNGMCEQLLGLIVPNSFKPTIN